MNLNPTKTTQIQNLNKFRKHKLKPIVVCQLGLSAAITSNNKQRNKNDVGLSFSQHATSMGSKLDGFFFNYGTRSFNSSITSLGEDEVLQILLVDSS